MKQFKLKKLLSEKYAWEREFGEPLPTLEDTTNAKSNLIMTEGTYPNQSEAETLIDWTNKMNDVYLGGSSLVKAAFGKADKIRLSVWDAVFGDKSPWKVVKGKHGKFEIAWDKDKASKLNI